MLENSHWEVLCPIALFVKNYLFSAVLGLRCWVRAFSSCSEQGLFFAGELQLLPEVVSGEGAQAPGVQASAGAQAQ